MSSKKNASKKSSTPQNSSNEASLERRPGLGMEPVGILAGYGPRGERIRHTVHNGALKLPRDALQVLDSAAEEMGLSPPEKVKLPGLDTVVRPTLDANLKSVIVTEIGWETVEVPDHSQPAPAPVPPGYPPPEQPMRKITRLRVANRNIQRVVPVVGENITPPPVDRIRGGGEDDKMDVDPPETSAAPAAAQAPPPGATQAQAPVSAPAPVPPQAPPAEAAAVAGPTSASVPAASGTAPVPQVTAQNALFAAPTVVAPPVAATQPATMVPIPVAAPATLAAPEESKPAVPPPPVATPSGAPPVAQSTVPTPVIPTTAPPSTTAPTSTPSASVPAAPKPVEAPSASPPTEKAATPAAAPVPSAAPSSSTTATTTEKAAPAPAPEPETTLEKLDAKPESRWEQHRPGPNDEMVTPEDQLTPKPSWYKKDGVSEIERAMLPEWFDQSAEHRTPETYIQARERILQISASIANRHITHAMVRRAVVGDAGSLFRLRNFLTHWGIINEDAVNDSTPTASILREKYPVPKKFNERQQNDLVQAVVESTKRRKIDSENSFVPINWNEVALKVGEGATSDDCERNFLSVTINPEETERPITPEIASISSAQKPSSKDQIRQEIIQDLVASCKPEVVRKVTAAALEAAAEPKEAQSGAIVGLMASKAVETAQQSENQLEFVLSQLLDQRMKRLENRMSMMNDVESILEAEKMALELERRDLYTARCRHWFGGA